MYEGWTLEKWPTPISDVESLSMVMLVDDGTLSIIVQVNGVTPKWFRCVFSKYPAYRNILEEFRTELWERLEQKKQYLGWTAIVNNSQWVSSFSREPLLKEHYPQLKHYLICTEDDVIEVLSPQDPEMREIAVQDSQTQSGKSDIYRFDKDESKIKEIFSKLKSGK